MSPSNPVQHSRREFFSLGAASVATGAIAASGAVANADEPASQPKIVLPPDGQKILLSCKLSMIAKERDGKPLTIVQRLQAAKEAGFDGVDFDEAGSFSPEQARQAVAESGVFVHNAINHAHWGVRLTSANPEERAQAVANLQHCVRVGHAAGGSGVLIVVGKASDGTVEETTERCRTEMQKVLPLAAALGQPILVENVWNQMFYDHDGSPEQTADKFVEFIDSFNSPWVGMYYDIGNHWKYGQPGDWIRAFGRRCVKLDVKGFSRAKNAFTDIGEGDLPWDQVRQALADIGFTGWATAEVGGGDVERLTVVRKQMEKALRG